MNIYINARFLTQPVTGVQRFAIQLVRQWDLMLEDGTLDPDVYRFTLLTPPGARRQLAVRNIPVRQVGSWGGHAWEQLVLPLYARDGLLVNLCNTGPLVKRRQIAAIHDAAVFEHPASFTFLFRNAYKVIQSVLGKQARSIITVSDFSKSQLIRHCRVNEGKIRVVSLGNEHMQELAADKAVFAKYGLSPKGYILAVSSMNPYKNFVGIVRALDLLKDRDYDIVIAGGENAGVFGAGGKPLSDKVKRVGYVTDGELKALYEGAACFVFPSYYEGFGLPPLEAMSCGTPTVVSHAASMPEVCGQACLYFDPGDPQDLAGKLDRLMTDARLRHRLRERGYRRAAEFSWDRCARQTLAVIKEAFHS